MDGLRETSEDENQGTNDFDIVLFDNLEGARLPIATWPSDWHYPLGQISQLKTGRFRVAIDRHTATVSVLDLMSRTCGVWVYAAKRLPYWWCATPFRLQFSWIADTFDAELVHAAAITVGERTSLLVGPSGAGKSTLSHALASFGGKLISDDFVVCENHLVSSPYLRTKLHDDAFHVLPALKQSVTNPLAPHEKRIISGMVAKDVAPSRVNEIVAVSRNSGLGFIPSRRGEVFTDIAIGTISGVLGGSRRSLSRIASLANAVPHLSFDPPSTLSGIREAWQSRG